MEQDQAIKVFESLASGLRLDVYRLLMRAGPEGLVAGDIASALNVPPTNLSFHLKALTQSGLLGVTPDGRVVEDGFGQDAARRVAGADEEHVQGGAVDGHLKYSTMFEIKGQGLL